MGGRAVSGCSRRLAWFASCGVVGVCLRLLVLICVCGFVFVGLCLLVLFVECEVVCVCLQSCVYLIEREFSPAFTPVCILMSISACVFYISSGVGCCTCR